ncbi:MAG: potassium channel protein [Nitrospirae bacterium]|nr:potassium channel protein [Nitrospirota bacterium]MBF0520682.1 potassium channel protein [Nitrospirota bacterium]MBF0520704.1 potassium channel protein [Nitrospirota bacterium]MBF0535263.1 potassium channel protein [Nitrospirota bacterium]MBF0615257.1 potassium channel protein [Nitrospirota bacterium]
MAVEGWNAFDSFYMVVITLATIGFQEVHPLSNEGRAFTIFLIFSGVGILAYNVNVALRALFEGEFQKILGRRKLEKKIKEIKDHYIICGFGRMGRIICKELRSCWVPFVVIDQEIAKPDEDEDYLFLAGDATHDEVLKMAGIERAKGIVSVLSTDANNLFVVLSARVLNPSLKIVARAVEESTELKLLRAGADRVVAPYNIGGLKIAQTILKPAVVDFLEFATLSGNIALQMEEIPVKGTSVFVERTVAETEIGRKFGIIIVAIKRSDGEMLFNPTHKTIIKTGDVLIALGEVNKLNEVEKLAGN